MTRWLWSFVLSSTVDRHYQVSRTIWSFDKIYIPLPFLGEHGIIKHYVVELYSCGPCGRKVKTFTAYMLTKSTFSLIILEHVQWISKSLMELLSEVPSRLQVDIRVQVTTFGITDVLPTLEKMPQQSARNSDEDVSSGSKIESEDKEDVDSESESAKIGGLRLHKGRPDIRGILEEEISCAHGPVSVDGEWISLCCEQVYESK